MATNEAPPAGGAAGEGQGKNIVSFPQNTTLPATDEVVHTFHAVMEHAGFAPGDIIPDGRVHCFHVQGEKCGKPRGWYVLRHASDLAVGIFGNSEASTSHIWRAQAGRLMCPDEVVLFAQSLGAAKQHRDAEISAERGEFAAEAQRQWVAAHGRETAPLGEPDGITPLVICQSFATAAAILAATGWPSKVVFDAARLESEAMAARTAYPNLSLIIAVDTDRRATDGTNTLNAIAAARAVGGSLAIPWFKGDEIGTTFNDLSGLRGLEAVRAALTAEGAP